MMRDIQARLVLAQRPFAGIVNDSYLEEAYKRESATLRTCAGTNWSCSASERAEGLYFDPLSMPAARRRTRWCGWRAATSISTDEIREALSQLRQPVGRQASPRLKGYSETRLLRCRWPPRRADTPAPLPSSSFLWGCMASTTRKIPALLIDFAIRATEAARGVAPHPETTITRGVLSSLSSAVRPTVHYFPGADDPYNFCHRRRGMVGHQPASRPAQQLLDAQVELLSARTRSLNS
jgi:hypothetical protein